MRRLLASRSTSAATTGVVLLLIAGGGYALAGAGSKTIHACVHAHGGGIYVAKRCAKGDRKLSWNHAGPTGPRGPQGPGATYLVYNAGGTAAGTATTIGKLGPFELSGSCQASGGIATGKILATHPAMQEDGMAVFGSDNSVALSASAPAVTNGTFESLSSSSSTPQTATFELTVIPTSGIAIQTLASITVAAGATNKCHFSATAIPLGGAPRSSAIRQVGPTEIPHHLSGHATVIAGVPVG